MTEDGKDNVRNETSETLKLEYKEVHAYWRTLTNIRFKLLAFVPTLTGLCVTFIPKTHQPLEAFAIGLLGFIATLGITFYDQRNSELYNASIERAAFLEREMKFKAPRPIKCCDDINVKVGGIFCLRPSRGRKFLGIIMYHDRGLSMVYASALGAWLFIIINSIFKLIFWPLTFSLLLAALLAIIIYLILQTPERHGYLFSIDTRFEMELNSNKISEKLKKEFKNNKFSLPNDATVNKENEKWVMIAEKKFSIKIAEKKRLIIKIAEKKFIIKKKEEKIHIYGYRKLLKGLGWQHIIWIEKMA